MEFGMGDNKQNSRDNEREREGDKETRQRKMQRNGRAAVGDGIPHNGIAISRHWQLHFGRMFGWLAG